MYNAKMRQYLRTEAATASPLAQVAILLEHCAGLLRRATVAIKMKDYEERFYCIDKVMVILSSIQSNLAIEKSVEATEINTFFQSMIVFLLDVSMNEDAVLCEKVETAIAEMASIWRLADTHGNGSGETGIAEPTESVMVNV